MKSRGVPGVKRSPPGGPPRGPPGKPPIKINLNWAAKGQVRTGASSGESIVASQRRFPALLPRVASLMQEAKVTLRKVFFRLGFPRAPEKYHPGPPGSTPHFPPNGGNYINLFLDL